MIKCEHCGSTDVQPTGIVKYSYPSYSVFICHDCWKEFDVCNTEEIPIVDYHNSVELPITITENLINTYKETGNLPVSVIFKDTNYTLYRKLFGVAYYQDLNKNLVHFKLEG